MHAFWNALEWLANTILFIWVGIALGFVLLEPSNPALKIQEVKFAHHLRSVDAGYAVVLYLWLLVSRGIWGCEGHGGGGCYMWTCPPQHKWHFFTRGKPGHKADQVTQPLVCLSAGMM